MITNRVGRKIQIYFGIEGFESGNKDTKTSEGKVLEFNIYKLLLSLGIIASNTFVAMNGFKNLINPNQGQEWCKFKIRPEGNNEIITWIPNKLGYNLSLMSFFGPKDVFVREIGGEKDMKEIFELGIVKEVGGNYSIDVDRLREYYLVANPLTVCEEIDVDKDIFNSLREIFLKEQN